jgi:precorrin-6A/cobalt-precorrin-6A reductase
MVPDMAGAAAALRDNGARRIFVTTGARDLEQLAAVPGAWFLVRLIEPRDTPLPLPHHAVIHARGPFTESAERRLMQEHGIDGLLAKHSGGGAIFGKVTAARELGVPVVMIERPVKEPAAWVETIDAAIAWLEAWVERD